jgi:hypothetical protein
MGGQTEEFISKIRPASGDMARLLNNAHYYRLMGRPQLALKELEEALLRDPDNLKVVDTLAHCYEEVGRFDRAQKLYEEALSRHADNAALHNNLCFSYYMSGRWEQAEACFRQALARNPTNTVARNNLGLLYCRSGKQEEARRLWRETEGEAGADQKVKIALEALGGSTAGAYAQSGGPRTKPPAVTAAKAVPPAPPAPPARAVASSKTPPPAPAATAQVASPPATPAGKPLEVAAKPAVAHRVEATAPSPVAPPPVAGPVKQTAAVLPEPAKPAPAKPEVKAPAATAAAGAVSTSAPPAAPPAAPAVETAAKAAPPAPAVVNQIPSPPAAITEKRSQEPVQPAPPEAPPLTDAAAALVASAALGSVVGAEPLKQAQALPAATVEKREAALPEAPKPAATVTVALPPSTAPALPKWLTAKELVNTGIEVRNGNGVRFMAHRARTALSREGFNVTRIGNHVNFGAEKTLIYYRPEASRVARSVGKKFFPTARMVQARKFHKNVEVKVVLGRDLLKRHDQLARLAME